MQYRKECSLPCQILILVNYVLEFSLAPKENTYTLSFCYFISLKQYREPTTFLMHLKVSPPLSVLLEKAITYKWSKCKGQVETICFSKFFFFFNVLQTVGSLFLMENTNRLGSIPSLLPIMRKLHLLSLAILRKSFAVIPTNPITDC